MSSNSEKRRVIWKINNFTRTFAEIDGDFASEYFEILVGDENIKW
jgi:hypothetical protein